MQANTARSCELPAEGRGRPVCHSPACCYLENKKTQLLHVKDTKLSEEIGTKGSAGHPASPSILSDSRNSWKSPKEPHKNRPHSQSPEEACLLRALPFLGAEVQAGLSALPAGGQPSLLSVFPRKQLTGLAALFLEMFNRPSSGKPRC